MVPTDRYGKRLYRFVDVAMDLINGSTVGRLIWLLPKSACAKQRDMTCPRRVGCVAPTANVRLEANAEGTA